MPGIVQTDLPLFPPLSRPDILHFQFSSWYPKFRHITMKSTIVPLGDDFRRYLLSDGVHIPQGCDGDDVFDDENEDAEDNSDSDIEINPPERFTFPELDAKIREAVATYGGVFPKLNFSSPKDASWILPSSSPLKCTLPSEVYMLLKSSDFILHDLSEESVFEGCLTTLPDANASNSNYELELVLRKWYHVDPSREFRCFVRGRRLLGISQRDTNYYDHLNEAPIKQKVVETIRSLWTREIKDVWPTYDYVFDVILTRDLKSGHVVDFNPYAPFTDALLFTYEHLRERAMNESNSILMTVDSQSHEAANRSSPANVHNMVPFEMMSLSSGQTIEDFARNMQAGIQDTLDNT